MVFSLGLKISLVITKVYELVLISQSILTSELIGKMCILLMIRMIQLWGSKRTELRYYKESGISSPSSLF